MALKKKLTKAEYDKLSTELKAAYKEGEYSDTFVLDTDEGEDDPAELRRAFLREKEERKKLARELKALKASGASGGTDDDNEEDDDNEDNDDNDNNGGGRQRTKAERRSAKDAKRIDETWKKKNAKEVGERDARIAAQNKFIEKQMISGAAERIAGKISTAPSLMAKAIAARLSVDFEGDEPELVILGEDGKPAAITLEKLEKEFVANKEYAAIIIGSKATGGGAPKGGTEPKSPGGSAPASGDKPASLAKLSGKELAEHLKAKKEAKQQGA